MLKWIRNIYDPTRPDAVERATRWPGDTITEAWQRQQDWLADKAIGMPVVTENTASMVTLKRLHMVGVYEEDEHGTMGD